MLSMADRRVVVAVDGSPAGLLAADLAAVEAVLRGDALTILHVRPRFSRPARSAAAAAAPPAQGVLTRAAERVSARHPGLSVDVELRHGRVGSALVRATEAADLLVAGRRGVRSSAGWESVPAHLVRHASCPVLVDRGRRVDAGTASPVILALSARFPSAAAVEQAFWAAAARDVPLLTLHVCSGPPDRCQVPARAGCRCRGATGWTLADLVDSWSSAYPTVRVQREVRHEREAAAVLQIASHSGCLVVTGTGAGRHGALVRGSVNRGLLNNSACPVLVVPTGAASPAGVRTGFVGAPPALALSRPVAAAR